MAAWPEGVAGRGLCYVGKGQRSAIGAEAGTRRTIRPVVASIITVCLVLTLPTWPTNVFGATAAGGPPGEAITGAGPTLRRWAASEPSRTPTPASSSPTRTTT